MKLRLLVLAPLTFLAGIASPPVDESWFKSDRLEVTAGGSASLSWRWKAATRGYLSSVGLVDRPSGDKLTVSPIETTSYVLVLEAPGVPPRVFAQRVVVVGAKGPAGAWPSDPFTPLPYQAMYQLPSVPLTTLAERVRKVLRDDRHFEIRQFSDAEGQLVFVSAFLQNPKLNETNERPRRLRRIAYRVALLYAKNPGVIHVNVSSIIEWRTAVDLRWFPESTLVSNLYQKDLADLWHSIGEH